MTITEKINASLLRHPEWPNHRHASNIPGATASMVRVARGGDKPDASKKSPDFRPMRRLADFRKTHDVRLMISAGIKRFLTADNYCTDQEFRELCGVHVANWRRYAELEEFAYNRVQIKGVIYWAAPSTIESMKEIVGMA